MPDESFESCSRYTLDAAQLLMPLVGFLPADDPRMRSTLEASAHELTDDGLVSRHPRKRPADALQRLSSVSAQPLMQ